MNFIQRYVFINTQLYVLNLYLYDRTYIVGQDLRKFEIFVTKKTDLPPFIFYVGNYYYFWILRRISENFEAVKNLIKFLFSTKIYYKYTINRII